MVFFTDYLEFSHFGALGHEVEFHGGSIDVRLRRDRRHFGREVVRTEYGALALLKADQLHITDVNPGSVGNALGDDGVGNRGELSRFLFHIVRSLGQSSEFRRALIHARRQLRLSVRVRGRCEFVTSALSLPSHNVAQMTQSVIMRSYCVCNCDAVI